MSGSTAEQSSLASVRRVAEKSAVLVPVVLTAVVYYPLTGTYFYSDDFLHFFALVNRGPLAYIFMPHAGHVYIVRNILYSLSYAAFGTDPTFYFWGVLLTHVANAALLYFVLRRLTESTGLAVFGATMWGMSPVNEGSLAWYSVYGHALAGTVLLVALLLIGRGLTRRVVRWCYVLVLAGTTTFGVGIGVAMALPFMVFLLPSESRLERVRPPWSLLIVVPLLYAGLLGLYASIWADGSEMIRGVTMQVQNWMVVPVGMSAVIGYGLQRLIAGFFLTPGVFPKPGPYTLPLAHALTALFLFAVAVAAVRSSQRTRRQLAAYTLLTLSCYGTVVLGRGWYFAQAGALMSLHARYQYVGLLALTIVICLLFAQLASLNLLRREIRTALLFAWLAVAVTAYARSGWALDQHDESRRRTAQVLEAIESTVKAQPPPKGVFIHNQPFAEIHSGLIKMTTFPGWAAVFIIFYPENSIDGQKIFFVERNPDIIAAHASGLRTKGLLVPPRFRFGPKPPRPAAGGPVRQPTPGGRTQGSR